MVFGIRFTHSQFFVDQCKKAFNDVDVDKDGALDLKELYLAILKLYDTLNGALPVRLRIPSDAEMRKLMQQHDKDASGKISLQEFTEMCRALIGAKNFWNSLFFKALMVLALKAVVFPLAARAAAEATKEGLDSAGLRRAKKLPTAVLSIPLCFAFETASKKTLPLPL